MALTILSDPSYAYPVSPAVYSRWLATESPNVWQFARKDYAITGSASEGGSPEYTELTLSTAYGGGVGDMVSVHNAYDGLMYTGMVVGIASPATTIVVDIPWVATFDGEYLNADSERDGYYVEGRLTVNGVVQALTVQASPNSFGVVDVDVSGLLRIMVALGKVGDYSTTLIPETTKGGEFTFSYREVWYGSDNSYTDEGNTWYYVEAVRSVEQGSNLYEFVPTEAQDAPFLNSFEQPVYWLGLPFDLSFLLPPQPVTSPVTELTVTIKRYNANNTLLSTSTEVVALTGLEGKVCSLNIDPASIEESAAYMTAEITTP